MTPSVLVVDDEAGLVEMIGLMLGMRGFDVRTATNGVAGLALAKAQPFSLILTDIMMPLMDGIEMIRNIRGTAEGATVPIIIMTAMPTDLGADERPLAQGVLTKPFSHQELFALVDGVLQPTRQCPAAT